MSEFLDILSSFPTVLWTVPFGVCSIFVILSLIGGFGADGVEMDADPGVDVDVDIDVDGDISVGHSGSTLFEGLLESLAVGTVPLTIVFTSVSGIGWLASFGLELTVADPIRSVTGSFIYSLLGFAVTFVLSLWATTWVVKPLKKVFVVHTQHSGKHLVGTVARVTSTKITASFGTAAVKAPDGSGDIILNVVSASEHDYHRDDEAVIVEYDEAKNLYTVAPLRSSGVHAEHDTQEKQIRDLDVATSSNPLPEQKTPPQGP